MIKKLSALALAVIMTFATAMPILAQNVPTEARLINVHNTEGDDIRLSRSLVGRSIEPRSGQRLTDGNVLNTGRNSFVYMQLDEASLIKMDESSQVQVSETRNLLTLSVQSGRALVEVTNQPAGHALETRIGNAVIAVRGTSFIAGRREGDYSGAVFVTMLSGYGVLSIAGADGTVTEVTVPAGSMVVTTPDVAPAYTLRHEFDIQEMGLFELGEVYTRSEALIEAGVLTIDMYEQLPEVINHRQTERNIRIVQEEAVVVQAAAQSIGFAAAPVIQLAAPVVTPAPTPTPAPAVAIPTGTRVGMVAAGFYHSLALRPDGTLWAWGRNNHGQLGDGTTHNQHGPVRIMDNVVYIAAGGYTSFAVRSDGSLWAWGRNNIGQLGDVTTADRHSPVRIMENVVSVSAALNHALAVRTDGSLWAWGGGGQGQLGSGNTRNSAAPIRVLTWNDVVMAAAGSTTSGTGYSMALRSDGSVWTWGSSSRGQLGYDVNRNVTSPERAIASGVIHISAGFQFGLAIMTDRSLHSWGDNRNNELGRWIDGRDTHVASRIMDINNVITSANGNNFAAAVTADGGLWTWGSNSRGRMATGSTRLQDAHAVPVRVMDGAASVSLGAEHGLVLLANGNVMAWGRNNFGQIGIPSSGTNDTRPNPLLVEFR